MFSYLPENAASTLAAFKYKGEDRSYIYSYFWRPLCRRVVEYLPRWLAPNVITVLALVIVSIVHCIVAWSIPQLKVSSADTLVWSNEWHNYTNQEQANYSTRCASFHNNNVINSRISSKKLNSINATPSVKLEQFREQNLQPILSLPLPPTRWLFVLCAFAIFCYQLLDNLDGHQARRLHFSSPLGLLMDHGCDAVNCIVSALTFASAINAGASWKTWLIVLNILTVFFMNTWEEYYIDALILPVINGPNEGLLMSIAIYLWTAWNSGPQWWSEHGIELPTKWLESILPHSWFSLFTTSPPVAAVNVEKWILHSICPWTLPSLASTIASPGFIENISGKVEIMSATTNSKHHSLINAMFDMPTSIRALLLYHVNCTQEYIANPPFPDKIILHNFNFTSLSSSSSSPVSSSVMVDHRYQGHSVIQNAVLKLYGRDEQFVRMRANTLMVWVMCALSLCTCLGNMMHVYRAIKKYNKSEMCAKFGVVCKQGAPFSVLDRLRLTFPFTYALTRLLPLVVLTFCANVWYFISPTQIFATHPRLFCWTVGLLYTKMCIHLMLSHLCAEPFRPFRRTFYPFMLFAIHLSLTYVHRVQEIMELNNNELLYNKEGNTVGLLSQNTIIGMDEEVLLYEFFTITVVSFIHLVFNATREVQSALQIPLFTVPAKFHLQTSNTSIKASNTVNGKSINNNNDDCNDDSVQRGKVIT